MQWQVSAKAGEGVDMERGGQEFGLGYSEFGTIRYLSRDRCQVVNISYIYESGVSRRSPS